MCQPLGAVEPDRSAVSTSTSATTATASVRTPDAISSTTAVISPTKATALHISTFVDQLDILANYIFNQETANGIEMTLL